MVYHLRDFWCTRLRLLLTVSIFEALLLLGRLRDDFYSARMKHSDIGPCAPKHRHGEHEVLPLVAVADEECLGGAVVLRTR